MEKAPACNVENFVEEALASPLVGLNKARARRIFFNRPYEWRANLQFGSTML